MPGERDGLGVNDAARCLWGRSRLIPEGTPPRLKVEDFRQQFKSNDIHPYSDEVSRKHKQFWGKVVEGSNEVYFGLGGVILRFSLK